MSCFNRAKDAISELSYIARSKPKCSTGCCPDPVCVDPCEETCEERLCRLEAYTDHLFARTDDLLSQLTGKDVGPALFTFTSDAGQVTSDQQLLSNQIVADDPTLAFFGGDNNYEEGNSLTIDANWFTFNHLIKRGIAFPALGNHDLDDEASNPGINQYNKFPYLPGNRRYYHIYNELADTDFFVLNTGVNTAGSVVEPDGNSVGSVQYKWFLDALSQSCGRFKVVIQHHPFVSGVTNAINDGRILTAVNWDFKSLGIDLLLNGHTHSAQHIATGDLDILDVSSAVRGRRAMSNSGTIYGSDADIAEIKWAYAGPGQTGERLYANLFVVGKVMSVSVKRITDGQVVYSFPIYK